ncbi:TRAF3-interacting protein 1 isoform X2 [Pygocentrus nattereri]|uniref:TRAF3-interacting protein 1 n=1 Tax=Pygocentrus nattereri TaxID=42514 RepID=A0A3B4DXD9_PYGNA|nr:TRAF3-interacting protein 1 isoform X2 [Pygocentrus nattereri]
MNGSVAKKTQETLGKVIKKPPLTEKLLSKPPFRYLHDIFSEVIRTTGFMKGLYGEAEMKSDNVKDKDSKIAFLQKAIDVVMLVSGEPLSAKPARIVAGHEPEKTNELLQAIAKCCLNKLSSDEAVRRVLAGDKLDLKGKASTSRSQGKENREGRERHTEREEKREIKESSLSREQKDSDHSKDPESKRTEKDRHRDGERSEKGRERDRTKDRDKDKSRDRDKDKARERERDKDRDRNKERERDKEREKNKERDSHKERERERDKDRDREREKRRDRDKEREKERERPKELEERPKEKTDKKARPAEELSRQRPHPEEPIKNHKAEESEGDELEEVLEAKANEPTEALQNQPESPARIPRPSSAKGQRRWPKAGAPDESDSDGMGDNPSVQKQVHLANGDASDIVPSHASHSSRRIPRPSSARPAPPRVKRQESYTDGGPVERLGSGKPHSAVIVEGKRLSEDEEEEDGQFVVEEAVPPPPDMPELEMEPSVELQGDERHGGLVKKILKTKKDFESSPSSVKSKDQDHTPALEAARKKERELVAREIERLRTSIQTVCRSALPLGKIMDYIQEDMDSMQNELQSWRRENKEHAQALQQEQRITDSSVEPLKAELAELEQLIKDQQDKICAIKANILRNEEKIHKMVSSINISSQT